MGTSLSVRSVLRSSASRESGKKKCRRPKLSTSLRQISLANALIAAATRDRAAEGQRKQDRIEGGGRGGGGDNSGCTGLCGTQCRFAVRHYAPGLRSLCEWMDG
eukprot:360194-Chlamydomonas_euryale.AAC.21